MSSKQPSYDQVQPRDRGEWRRWLEEHHETASGVWLVSFKKRTGQPYVEYAEAVEEALCFGWIDSRPNAIDAERAMRLFTPRNAGSPWSKLNKERIARLIAEGRMAPAGLAKIEAAKADGSWTAYDIVEAMTVPPDLVAALAANPTARDHFAAFSNSERKQLLWWVESAKRPETRATRIATVVAEAAERRNPLNWRAKQQS